MPPRLRRFALATHLACSVGWIGGVGAYLVLSVAAMTARDAATVRAAWIAMDLVGWYAIVPAALASVLTGLVVALGSPWGLLRHYWVLISFLLTTFAAVVLLLHMPDVSVLADAAREARGAIAGGGRAAHPFGRLRRGDLLHPALGLVVLLVVHWLNVSKPRGMTPYGRRREAERTRAVSTEGTQRP